LDEHKKRKRLKDDGICLVALPTVREVAKGNMKEQL